jgi:DNA repair protein RadA/Sms
VFGEVGLAGEVRGVGQVGLRLREAAQMGFTRCIVPERTLEGGAASEGLEVVGVRSLDQALEHVLA